MKVEIMYTLRDGTKFQTATQVNKYLDGRTEHAARVLSERLAHCTASQIMNILAKGDGMAMVAKLVDAEKYQEEARLACVGVELTNTEE